MTITDLEPAKNRARDGDCVIVIDRAAGYPSDVVVRASPQKNDRPPSQVKRREKVG